jgi:hypothetical protein
MNTAQKMLLNVMVFGKHLFGALLYLFELFLVAHSTHFVPEDHRFCHYFELLLMISDKLDF